MMNPARIQRAPQPTILTGSQAIQQAEQIKRQYDKQSAWPYEWCYAPQNSSGVFRQGFIAVPADGAVNQAVVLQYNVPDSVYFVLQGVSLNLIGATWNPGDFTWLMDVNAPIGLPSAQATPLQGYGAVGTELGSLQDGPYPYVSGELDILKPRDQLRLKVTNNALVAGTGSFVATFTGYTLEK